MTQLVFLLEEPSARELLKGLIPRIVPEGTSVTYLVFEGKQDLEKQLTMKIRAWRAPDSAFVVLRDQDQADCKAVKRALEERVAASGQSRVLIRVACRDLEAWVAGDLPALAEAFDEPKLATHSTKERFRQPDTLVRPVEAIRQILPEYQKIDGARRVGPFLNPEASHSKSFVNFCRGVQRLFASQSPTV